MTSQHQAAIEAFATHFGKDFTTNFTTRQQHAHTQTWLSNQPADGVLFAQNKQMLVDAVKLASQYQCPIIPFGIGSSLEGHVNAPHGGVCIDVSNMNQVLAIHAEDLCATVQPGVTREALNQALRHTGLFFPIDPGANATLGGMTSTRASGTNAVRYGTMKDVILSLEVITATGEIIKTASRAKKSAAGYDLTRLFIGAEGTLGLISELTVKVFGRPEVVAGGVCAFPTVNDACLAVIQTIQYGIPVARIELLDELQVRACNNYSKLNMPELPTLFVEFHGSPSSVTDQAKTFGDIAQEHGAGIFNWSSNEAQSRELWKARHNAYFAVQSLRPDCKPCATDACVPISRLADCVAETRADIEVSGLIAPIVGHVGDGNFHVSLLIDVNNPQEIENAENFMARLSERAIRMGGTCTGEHGIGQGKQKYLCAELGDNTIEVMRIIKRALDPQNIMNPGKIFGLE